MKVKTWHLFALVIILFIISYVIINQKFDPFYRVNGINNDNRVLLETYLDEDEQTYLIDNQISIDEFIDYIENDAFVLQNYQYYNALKDSKRYNNDNDILNTGNSLATRLTYLFQADAQERGLQLIQYQLEQAFLNDSDFDFTYIDYYKNMVVLYDDTDYSFVEDTTQYITLLTSQGVRDNELEEVFESMTQGYTQNSLKQLLTSDLPQNVRRVYDPYKLSTIVNETHYIGEYEPNGLLLAQDIPRLRYSMYLQNDAYNALLKMYQDLNKEASGFLLREAYLSPHALSDKDVGYNELQLGLTITVSKSETAYRDFEDTDVSKWLEEHAYEYGYVLRYPKHKASITDHQYDSHVYRYVGKTLAKSLHDSNLTLEEYSVMEE